VSRRRSSISSEALAQLAASRPQAAQAPSAVVPGGAVALVPGLLPSVTVKQVGDRPRIVNAVRPPVGGAELAELLARRPQAHRPSVRADRSWYRIENHDAGEPVEVWIYDEIGYWGVTADDFARELAEVDAEEITVRLNSPGGDVFDGIAILNALRSHPAAVTVQVDGLAASAASFIAQAGDRIVMQRQAQMMIHDASGLCIGQAVDMEQMRALLDKISANIASVYADRAGGGAKKWRTAMLAETWYSAQEAVDAGLADEVAPLPAKKDQPAAAATWDLSVFRHAGREHAPAPTAAAAPDPATPEHLDPEATEPAQPEPRPAPAGTPDPPAGGEPTVQPEPEPEPAEPDPPGPPAVAEEPAPEPGPTPVEPDQPAAEDDEDEDAADEDETNGETADGWAGATAHLTTAPAWGDTVAHLTIPAPSTQDALAALRRQLS
jgi:ATP-dependent protease ClpP protease subunit